jgi:hypothetical protein
MSNKKFQPASLQVGIPVPTLPSVGIWTVWHQHVPVNQTRTWPELKLDNALPISTPTNEGGLLDIPSVQHASDPRPCLANALHPQVS